MRSKTLWLGAALIVGLFLMGMAVADPGGKDGTTRGVDDKGPPGKDGPPGKFGPRDGKDGPFPGGPGGFVQRGLGADDIIDRLMSFDKNKDGKITKDELPERMQDLVAKGDGNKDGALDKDEIKKLATELARDGFPFGGPGGLGGRFVPGGPFPPGGPFGPGGLTRALDDLKLTDKKRDQAEALVKEHQEKLRKMNDDARADLLKKMKDVLSEEELKSFKEALERRPPGAPPFAPAGPPPGDVERRIEQLQRELDNLRREIRRP